MADAAKIAAACRRLLGTPVSAVTDLSWPGSSNLVLELTDTGGRSWIAKSIGDEAHYRQELSALRHWAPALHGAAPSLEATDDELRLLVMTRLAGRRAEEMPANTDPAVHREAGGSPHCCMAPSRPGPMLTSAQPLPPSSSHGSTAGGTCSARTRSPSRAARSRRWLAGPLPTVPCHQDNQPRNWVVDNAGHVGMIDFGLCKRDVWIRDLQRLYFQQWEHRPDLRDAFYAGYGRTPDAADLELLRCYLAYSGLSTVIWAHEFGDPQFEAHGHRILAELISGADPAR